MQVYIKYIYSFSPLLGDHRLYKNSHKNKGTKIHDNTTIYNNYPPPHIHPFHTNTHYHVICPHDIAWA